MFQLLTISACCRKNGKFDFNFSGGSKIALALCKDAINRQLKSPLLSLVHLQSFYSLNQDIWISAIGVKALDNMIAIPIYLGLAIVQAGTCKVDEQRHCCSGIYLKETTQCRLVDREVRETQCV